MFENKNELEAREEEELFVRQVSEEGMCSLFYLS